MIHSNCYLKRFSTWISLSFSNCKSRSVNILIVINIIYNIYISLTFYLLKNCLLKVRHVKKQPSKTVYNLLKNVTANKVAQEKEIRMLLEITTHLK